MTTPDDHRPPGPGHAPVPPDVEVVRLAPTATIDRRLVTDVAHGQVRLALSDATAAHLDVTRAACLAALSEGQRVYGVTTGMGFRSDVDLTTDQQAHHQASLLLGRAVGGPPYLDVVDARAVVVARLVNLVSGHAGVSGELVRWLLAWLDSGEAPAIPASGVGTAGEVQPLAHAFQPMLGTGRVLASDGTVLQAADALRSRGAEPYRPGPKEGIALLAGAPAAAGMGAVAHARVLRLADSLELVATAALEVIDAPPGTTSVAAAELAGDPVLTATLARMRALRETSHLDAVGPTRADGWQAPVSFRVSPTVQAHLLRTLGRFADDVDLGLAAVTDSPALVDGAFVATAGFHALDIAAGLDTVRAALVRSTELACQRIHRLLDARITGLPAQLAADGGTGLIVVHKRAVAAAAEARRLAVPVTVGLADTSLGQEDAQTFSFEAFAALRRVEALAADVAGCELACVLQAVHLRGRPLPPRLASAIGAAERILAPVLQDRSLGDELDGLAALVGAGGLHGVAPTSGLGSADHLP